MVIFYILYKICGTINFEKLYEMLKNNRWEGLRHLLNFRFKKHTRYNLPPKRLALLENQIKWRAGALLAE